jgi:hypothetical protein
MPVTGADERAHFTTVRQKTWHGRRGHIIGQVWIHVFTVGAGQVSGWMIIAMQPYAYFAALPVSQPWQQKRRY